MCGSTFRAWAWSRRRCAGRSAAMPALASWSSANPEARLAPPDRGQHSLEHPVLQHIMVIQRGERVDQREDDDRPADPFVDLAQVMPQRLRDLADQRRDAEAEEFHR